MGIRIKCEQCLTTHGGFHLCLGPVPKQDYKAKNNYSSQARSEAAKASQRKRWESKWAETAERDHHILDMYEEGYSFSECGETYNLTKHQVRDIVHRLGGNVRSAHNIYTGRRTNA